MKRSEMLEIIENVMSSNHPALNYKENAEDILNRIEDAGMLPPNRNGCEGCSQCTGPDYNWDYEETT